jgi:hypothetical protein
MNATQTEKPEVTWTNFRDQWMIRSTTRLTEGELVEVTAKSGAVKTVRVGEYEHKFAGKDGGPTIHIFTVI